MIIGGDGPIEEPRKLTVLCTIDERLIIELKCNYPNLHSLSVSNRSPLKPSTVSLVFVPRNRRIKPVSVVVVEMERRTRRRQTVKKR